MSEVEYTPKPMPREWPYQTNIEALNRLCEMYQDDVGYSHIDSATTTTAASGSVVGVITQPAALLQSQLSLDYFLPFATGLTIVTSLAVDMTVVYR